MSNKLTSDDLTEEEKVIKIPILNEEWERERLEYLEKREKKIKNETFQLDL